MEGQRKRFDPVTQAVVSVSMSTENKMAKLFQTCSTMQNIAISLKKPMIILIFQILSQTHHYGARSSKEYSLMPCQFNITPIDQFG